MKMKLIAVVSWAGVLLSAVSEYTFDADFPLTPSLWLVIAIFTVLGATAHAAIGSRIHGSGKQTVAYRLGDVSSLSDSAGSISDGNKSPQVSGLSQNICQDNLDVADDQRGQMSSGDVIGAVRDAIPAITFLNPATTRGPPWSDNQIDRTLGRPARYLYTTQLPSESHLSSSRSNETIAISPPSRVLARSGLSLKEKTT